MECCFYGNTGYKRSTNSGVFMWMMNGIYSVVSACVHRTTMAQDKYEPVFPYCALVGFDIECIRIPIAPTNSISLQFRCIIIPNCWNPWSKWFLLLPHIPVCLHAERKAICDNFPCLQCYVVLLTSQLPKCIPLSPCCGRSC